MPSGRHVFTALAILMSVGLLAAGALAQDADKPAEPQGDALISADQPTDTPPAAEGDASPPATGDEKAPGDTGKEEGGKPGGGNGGSPFSPQLLLIIVAVFALMMIWQSRSRKKQQAKRDQMLAALKKGDKVTSIGGIVGTIIEAREDEIVIKVDETNNVRMHFARWAVRGTGDEAKTEHPDDKK